MLVKINTRTSRLDTTTIMNIATLTMNWCINNLPPPKKKGKLMEIFFQWDDRHDNLGRFAPKYNWICINMYLMSSVRDIVSTTIHEYCHSTQNLKKYNKILLKVGYNNHPQEKEANKYEKKYTNICWKSIRKKINS